MNIQSEIPEKLQGWITKSIAVILFVLVSFSSLLVSNSPVKAATVNDYPWLDATHVPQPTASDPITWGYTDKGTCDNKSSAYDCDTHKIGTYYVRDQWKYDLRNCTSYVAWRVAVEFGVNASGMGSATNWDNAALTKGWSVDTTPEVGDIAQWEGEWGHVAFVERVNANGSVNISEFNSGMNGNPGTRNGVRADHYIDINGSGLPLGGGQTGTNSTNSLGYNGDTFGDIAILLQRPDAGMDAHVFYGSTGTPFQHPNTLARVLPGSSGWRWSQIKTGTGDFNGDTHKDIVLMHQTPGGGADVHILYGGNPPFQYSTTYVRSLPASSGWNWSQMKIEAGRYNGDIFDDLTILHKLPDGGVDVHVLYGSTGTPLRNSSTHARRLPASSGWNWNLLKTSSGDFNGDTHEDIALVHQNTDGGAGLHVLYGGNPPFTHVNTLIKQLPASSGWNWSQMKIEGGRFNGDVFGDLAIIHKTSTGMDVHVFYGSTGTPFQYPTTFTRSLPASSGWNWDGTLTGVGDFNGDSHADIALVHKLPDSGADIHVLYGSNPPFQYANTFVKRLPASSGWDWNQMIVEAH